MYSFCVGWFSQYRIIVLRLLQLIKASCWWRETLLNAHRWEPYGGFKMPQFNTPCYKNTAFNSQVWTLKYPDIWTTIGEPQNTSFEQTRPSQFRAKFRERKKNIVVRSSFDMQQLRVQAICEILLNVGGGCHMEASNIPPSEISTFLVTKHHESQVLLVKGADLNNTAGKE